MKHNKILALIAGIAIALMATFYGCNKKSTSNEVASITDSQLDGSGNTYAVDTAASVIDWVGSTPGNYQHTGTIKLATGKLTAKDNRLTGGEFVILMNSISNSDQTGKDKSNLENHLKDGDFFEIEKFPYGNFELTQTKTEKSNQIIIGNLTLKNVTKSIQIPVALKIDEQTITAETPAFSIDRTQWGVVYNSGIIGTLKDDLIKDEIKLKLKIVATRQ